MSPNYIPGDKFHVLTQNCILVGETKESAEETNKALIGVLAGIIALARDPAGSTLKLREALNEYEFKAAIEWLKVEGK